jgi:threonine/homoserine/homoserine lactone efflux protein
VEVVALGFVLGLGAGLAPGPLMALVVAAALERGFAAGARVAVAPLITDAPIVALSALVLSGLPDEVLAGLSFAGAAFVLVLAADALRTAPGEGPEPTAGTDLRRGAIANALSPHPWLFWIAVGGPLLVDAARDEPAAAVGFLVAFYSLLIGTKLVLAALVAAGRNRSWRRAIPGGLTAKVGAPAVLTRLGAARIVSAALLAAAAIALALDGLARL